MDDFILQQNRNTITWLTKYINNYSMHMITRLLYVNTADVISDNFEKDEYNGYYELIVINKCNVKDLRKVKDVLSQYSKLKDLRVIYLMNEAPKTQQGYIHKTVIDGLYLIKR